MKKKAINAAAVALAGITVLAVAACAPSAPGNTSSSGASSSADSSGGGLESSPAADTGTGSSSPAAPSGGSGDTLTIATTSDVVNYNPLIGNSRTDLWITGLMYPKLLTISADGVKSANLATKWGYTDQLHGFYEIRSDMKWSDGEPVTAADVAYTMNAVKKDQPAGVITGQLSNFESATASSNTRVDVTLSAPDATVINEFGFWAEIVPEHVFSKHGSIAKFANDQPEDWVSAGPYKLTKVEQGQRYTLERVEPYPLVAGGVPGPAKVVYAVYPDVNSEILALRNGDVDLIANALPPSQVDQLKADPALVVEQIPGLGYTHLSYNMDRKPLDQLAVRRALSQTVDYQAIINVVYGGNAVSTNGSPVMPVLSSYYQALEPYAYDPDAARKILEGAGYTADSSGNFPIKLGLIYSLQDPNASQYVSIIKDGAAKAGITIDLQGMERNTWLAKANDGDFDIYAGDFAIMDDPVTNMTLTYLPGGVINYSHVDDPKLNDLIKQAQVTTDQKVQIEKMQEAAEIVHDNVYDNVMFTQNLAVAHSKSWSGFVIQPSELLSIINPVSIASAVKAK